MAIVGLKAHGDKRVGLSNKIKTILGSNWFLGFVIVLFCLQAGYIALRNVYPMAFDESHHLGIIQLHAQQWSPYFANLPDSTAQYGALATDPSYLFHYLMSFPYRLIKLVTNDPVQIIIALRFINIAFFAAGIFTFSIILRHLQLSNALINTVLLLFALLPLQSFTAAHINYDNLLFLMTALVLLTALKFTRALLVERRIDLLNLTLTLSLCLIATQVKYVFMPIMAAVCIYLSGVIIVACKRNILQKDLFSDFKNKGLSKKLIIVLILFAVSLGMFGWRFGNNIATYGSLVPRCEVVVNAQACSSYGVWARNNALEKSHVPEQSLLQTQVFVKWWAYIMGSQLFSILNTDGGRTEKPVKQFVIGALAVALLGGVMIVLQLRYLISLGYAFWLVSGVSFVYLSALIYQNYTDFIHYGIPIAIQGRYLLPILILLMAVAAQACARSLYQQSRLRSGLLIVILLIFVQGGGLVTYLIRTDESWRWTQGSSAELNTTVFVNEFASSQSGITN